MPATRDGKKGEKKKKVPKPEWLTEEMFELSQDMAALAEFYGGDTGKNKKKKTASPPKRPNGKAGAQPEAPSIKLTKPQAALFIWQLVYPNTKTAKDRRDEAVKLTVVEMSLKAMASGDPALMTPAAGILCALLSTPLARTILSEARLTTLARFLAALDVDSTPLAASVCSLLRAMATAPELRPRLYRAMKEWNLAPLCKCVGLQTSSHLGGRMGALDAVGTLDALCGAPETDIANFACGAVVACGGLAHIVAEMRSRRSHSGARSLGASLLSHIMKRAPSDVCANIVADLGAIDPLVELQAGGRDGGVPLPLRAAAASCLLRYMLPDSIWNGTGAPLAPGLRPKASEMNIPLSAPESPDPDAIPADDMPAPTPTGALLTSGVSRTFSSMGGVHSGVPLSAMLAATGGTGTNKALKLAWGGPAGLSGPPNVSAIGAGIQATLKDVSRQMNIAFSMNGGMDRTGGVPIRDEDCMDEETKKEVLLRAKRVAEAGAVPSLIRLCVGPEGPMPEIPAPGAESDGGGVTTGAGAKKKKGKKKSKKKAKLEPGMAEAQSYGSACLRLISMSEEWRAVLVTHGAVRYLTPLLQSRVNPARWNARQTLLNLSMTPPLIPSLSSYKVPVYITATNIPATHYSRPFTAPAAVGGGDLGSSALASNLRVPAGLGGAGAGRFARPLRTDATALDRLDGTSSPASKNGLLNSALAERNTGAGAMLPLPNPGGGGLTMLPPGGAGRLSALGASVLRQSTNGSSRMPT